MKKRIVLYKRLSDQLMQRLQAHTEVTLVEAPAADGLARLRAALPGAHGLLGASLRLGDELLDLAPELEVVSSVSVGVDNYDIAELDRRGVLLTNTPTCSPRPQPTPGSPCCWPAQGGSWSWTAGSATAIGAPG